MRPSTRHALNWANGTTAVGFALARLTRSPILDGPLGTYIATEYPLRVPDATCFVMGDVIFCRHTRNWLLADVNRPTLRHEMRHTYQYAQLGPLFWPLYFASCGWSFLATGSYGARNGFERQAGLADGGYADRPLRPLLHTVLNYLGVNERRARRGAGRLWNDRAGRARHCDRVRQAGR